MAPLPASKPPRDASNTFVFMDENDEIHAYRFSREDKSVNKESDSGTVFFPVEISLYAPSEYEGVYLFHEQTQNEIKLPYLPSISWKLPEGKYKLYIIVNNERFPPDLNGVFEVGAELNEFQNKLSVECRFKESILTWFSAFNAEVFEEEDFVYSINNDIYKEDILKYKDKNTDHPPEVAIRKKNHPEPETLIRVTLNLGIPDEVYGSLFKGFGFIIHRGNDKKSDRLSMDDLKQLSMRPGEYAIEKFNLTDTAFVPWDGEPMPFTISETNKNIDLGFTYEDALRLTGHFLLVQDGEPLILRNVNGLEEDPNVLSIEDLLSHADEVRMYDAYMDWNEDVDIMMQDEEVQIYLNGNKIEKKRGLLNLSRGEYTTVIKVESTGWKEEIQSQPISLPAEGAANKFTFDSVQLNDIQVKLAEEKVEPEWLFEYKTEYYKVGIGEDQNPKTIQINKAKFDEVLEKQDTEKESPIFLSINYSPDLDIPEGLIIKVTPVKTGELKKPLSAGEVLIGQGKLSPDHNVMEESVNVYSKSNEHVENTAPTQKGIEDTQKSGPMEATVSGGRGLPIMSIYLMNKIESLNIELVIPNGGVTKPFTFLLDNKSPNTPVSVTFTNLRKIIKDLSRDANEFILKATDENERIIPIDTPTDDRSHIYALLRDGTYILEAVNGEADPMKKAFTIENGIVTVIPEDDNNTSALE